MNNPEGNMALNDIKIKNSKPQSKPYKISDGDGLSLLVNPNGSKWWRFRYTVNGKEKGISFGVYPDVSLQSAREKRAKARVLVASGVDPSAARQAVKDEVANTFESVALQWYGKISHTWGLGHAKVIKRLLEKDIFPVIGKKSISKIVPGDVLEALRKIESRGAVVTAKRACRVCSQIFRYSITLGFSTIDPSYTLKDVLRKTKTEHFPALTDTKDVTVLLRAIDAYQGTFVVKSALQIAPLFFVRPGELRHAEWTEVDFEAAIWSIPAEKMKMRMPHIVPLSRQAFEILKPLHALTGNGRYIFPSARGIDKPMSNSSFFVAFKSMGFDGTMSPHGFRAIARTLLDEILQFPYHLIEHQLAHAVRDPNGRAYNRTSHLAERAKMMQVWADYLEGLKAGAKVIPLKRAGATV